MSCGTGKTLLAEGPFCKVEGCACGTMHVSIGPFTVRLRPDVVASISETLGEALAARVAHETARRSALLS